MKDVFATKIRHFGFFVLWLVGEPNLPPSGAILGWRRVGAGAAAPHAEAPKALQSRVNLVATHS